MRVKIEPVPDASETSRLFLAFALEMQLKLFEVVTQHLAPSLVEPARREWIKALLDGGKVVGVEISLPDE